MVNGTITAIEGVKVGQAQDEVARTGCTVILFDKEADIACDARGGWTGTYDVDSVGVGKAFVRKHAIFLTGGDVFGFDVAIGIRRYLIERGIALPKGAGKLPAIVGANIYDVEFADTTNNKYPIDTPEHIRAAWSYINHADNAAKYGKEEVMTIKDRIKRAARTHGVAISED